MVPSPTHIQGAPTACPHGAEPGLVLGGLEGRGPAQESGGRRLRREKKKTVGKPTLLPVGLFGRACQKPYGELAAVQTSSRNTENNHILLIIAKENTPRLQLNYIKT